MLACHVEFGYEGRRKLIQVGDLCKHTTTWAAQAPSPIIHTLPAPTRTI